MNAIYRIVSVSLLLASLFFAGQAPAPSVSATPDNQTLTLHIDSQGHDVTAPRLLPEGFPVNTAASCTHSQNSEFPLLVIIDAQGRPHLAPYVEGQGSNGWFGWARRILADDRFQPAMRGNRPVATAQLARIHIESCQIDLRTNNGESLSQTYLHAQPVQQFSGSPFAITKVLLNPDGSLNQISTSQFPAVYFSAPGHVTSPKAVYIPPAQFPKDARRAHIQGVCWLSFIVDKRGIPTDIQILQSADPRLNANAVKSASASRFKPARLEGKPVPVLITMQVAFRLY